jgi:hypothetical protein
LRDLSIIEGSVQRVVRLAVMLLADSVGAGMDAVRSGGVGVNAQLL